MALYYPGGRPPKTPPILGGLPASPDPPGQAEDLSDQGRVLGAVPGVPLEQPRRRLDKERRQRAVGLGQIQRAFESPAGGGRVRPAMRRRVTEGASRASPAAMTRTASFLASGNTAEALPK